MSIAPLSIRADYWDNFEIQSSDLEFLYNHLIELETPQTPSELLRALISERIKQEIEQLKSQQTSGGAVYLPKNHYQVGQKIAFPGLDWKNATVKKVRPGTNPELAPFEVMDVQFEDGEVKSYASGLEDHKLNKPVDVKLDDPLLSEDYILKKYSHILLTRLTNYLEANPDLVRIAGKWFPRALLVDVNIGHLNLAEAVLEMADGGPLPTRAILEQIELPTDVNLKLTEFSLNLALQEDGRFDEVGPAGVVLWFLRRLEPEWVQNVPPYLKPSPFEVDNEIISTLRGELQKEVIDELEPEDETHEDQEKLTINLIFPHWRAGTLPITKQVSKLLPTAYESPRVQFTFVDRDTKQRIPSWVVRSPHYVYGLRDWYQSQGVIPGSLINIQRSKIPGEAIIWVDKRRPAREWIRTVLVGADGGIVYAMLKQMVVAAYDERMAVAVPDLAGIDQIWETPHRQKNDLEQTIHTTMVDLAKLSPQGHVHALELYATVNLIRRCPPSAILSILTARPWSQHLGDLYFKPEEAALEGNS
ncbi:MAG TPA: hypothetical protein VMS73_08425 [Anaerolineaceae bacterium]|nr:hypothetical protein [Anaerolineaceae bacterium]